MRAYSIGSKAVLISLLVATAGVCHAQAYPVKPVKIVVPFAAGGGVDQVARIVAAHWQTALKGNFIVENRPGGSTFIATEAVGRSEPDGYTLLLTTQNTFAINPLLFKSLPYAVKDFAPVGQISTVPSFFAVASDSPIRSMADFVSAAKKTPGVLSFASAGAGTASHLGFAMLNQQTGTQMIHAPYKSYAASMPDVISGRVTSILADLPVINGPLKAGKLRLLATSTATRSEFMPDVPTVNEALGLKEYNVANWFAVYAPKGTPTSVIDTLNAELQKFVRSPEGTAKLKMLGHTPVPSTPEGLAVLQQEESLHWAPLIKALDIHVEQ